MGKEGERKGGSEMVKDEGGRDEKKREGEGKSLWICSPPPKNPLAMYVCLFTERFN